MKNKHDYRATNYKQELPIPLSRNNNKLEATSPEKDAGRLEPWHGGAAHPLPQWKHREDDGVAASASPTLLSFHCSTSTASQAPLPTDSAPAGAAARR